MFKNLSDSKSLNSSVFLKSLLIIMIYNSEMTSLITLIIRYHQLWQIMLVEARLDRVCWVSRQSSASHTHSRSDSSPAGVCVCVCVCQSLMHSDLVTVMRGGAAYSKSMSSTHIKAFILFPFTLLSSASLSALICGFSFCHKVFYTRNTFVADQQHHSQKKRFGHKEGSCHF